jgi:hypothetical protein
VPEGEVSPVQADNAFALAGSHALTT